MIARSRTPTGVPRLQLSNRAWIVSVDPAREHEVARAIVDRLVSNGIGIEHFSRVTASLQQIYRVAVERTGADRTGHVA